jgi:CRISPR-associated protein Csx10
VVVLSVSVRLKSPLLAGDNRPGPHEQRTAGYLPGATLRGALGALLAARCGHDQHGGTESCEYALVFCGASPPRFGPCYPSAERLALPWPATARTCKHFPGLLDANDPDRHGVSDGLFATYLQGSRERAASVNLVCNVCRADLEPTSGHLEIGADGKFYEPRLWIKRFSRTAIDRARGTAADELLYTLEVVSEQMDTGRQTNHGTAIVRPTQLAGRVWVDEPLAKLVANRLAEVEYLGGDSSRGLGWVSVTVSAEPPTSDTSDSGHEALAKAARTGKDWGAVRGPGLAWRISRFNDAFRQAHQAEGAAWPAGSIFFSLDLHSDTLWRNNGLPTTCLPEEFLGARRVGAFVAPRTISGWNVAAGMMRAPRLAIAAGSVVLYQFSAAGDADRLGTLLSDLARLETSGLGDNLERGHGWVEICAPFHLEVKPR